MVLSAEQIAQINNPDLAGQYTQIPLGNDSLMPYGDLKAQGGYNRHLVLPDDVPPVLALPWALGPIEPRLNKCDDDGSVWTSLHGVGETTDKSVTGQTLPAPSLNVHVTGGVGTGTAQDLPIQTAQGFSHINKDEQHLLIANFGPITRLFGFVWGVGWSGAGMVTANGLNMTFYMQPAAGGPFLNLLVVGYETFAGPDTAPQQNKEGQVFYPAPYNVTGFTGGDSVNWNLYAGDTNWGGGCALFIYYA